MWIKYMPKLTVNHETWDRSAGCKLRGICCISEISEWSGVFPGEPPLPGAGEGNAGDLL